MFGDDVLNMTQEERAASFNERYEAQIKEDEAIQKAGKDVFLSQLPSNKPKRTYIQLGNDSIPVIDKLISRWNE